MAAPSFKDLDTVNLLSSSTLIFWGLTIIFVDNWNLKGTTIYRCLAMVKITVMNGYKNMGNIAPLHLCEEYSSTALVTEVSFIKCLIVNLSLLFSPPVTRRAYLCVILVDNGDCLIVSNNDNGLNLSILFWGCVFRDRMAVWCVRDIIAAWTMSFMTPRVCCLD